MKPRILFVHNHPSKFVQIDLALLQQRFEVREWYQAARAIDVVTLARAVRQSDLVFGWFASWHTLFPVLFAYLLRRPSLVVVGGYDTAKLPEIGYGSQRGGFKRWVAQTTMRKASHLITNSDYTCRETVANAHVDPMKISVIYHGLPYKPACATAKEDLVITVGNVDRGNLQRKGLELFAHTAAECPARQFVLVGAWRDDAIRHLQAIASPNLTFTGWINEDDLSDYFSRASVYVQVSRHEGFGLAVAQAMQYACVPVVTSVGSLPEVVGTAGVYVDSFEPSAVGEGIRRAFALAGSLGPRARARIAEKFPLEKRREKLYHLIDGLIR